MQEKVAEALFRVRQGNRRKLVIEDLPETFIVGEDEDLVLPDGAAERAAELVADELRLLIGYRLNGTDGIQARVANVVPRATMEVICAAAGLYVDNRARHAAIFGGVIVGLQAELVDSVRRWRDVLILEALVRGPVIRVLKTVEHELVELRAHAVDVVRVGAAGCGLILKHRLAGARSKQYEISIGSPVQGQILHLSRSDDLASRTRLRLQQLGR